MNSYPDIASVASLFADPSRARMLLELSDGEERSVNLLASIAGVASSTASEHLSRLEKAGLVKRSSLGRQRNYSISDEKVFFALEAMAPLASPEDTDGNEAYLRWALIRSSRRCYDHIAGQLGTDLLASLCTAGAITCQKFPLLTTGRSDALNTTQLWGESYTFGPRAQTVLAELDIDIDMLLDQNREALLLCDDWTEKRRHLAGGLGAALLRSFLTLGWLEPDDHTRAFQVSKPAAISEWFTSIAADAATPQNLA